MLRLSFGLDDGDGSKEFRREHASSVVFPDELTCSLMLLFGSSGTTYNSKSKHTHTHTSIYI